MFILNRQDVEISSIPHPHKEGLQISVLSFQNQTFGLLSMFDDNREEALIYWRDLVDNKGKVCVLLEEPEIKRYSVWGKFSLNKETGSNAPKQKTSKQAKPTPTVPNQVPSKQVNSVPKQVNPQSSVPKQVNPQSSVPKQVSAKPEPIIPQLPEIEPLKSGHLETFEGIATKACLLILQTIYLEINDLFGRNQGNLFKLDIMKFFKTEKFPQIDSIQILEQLLATKNLIDSPTPNWNDSYLQLLLSNLYKVAQSHFGNTVFLEATRNAIADLPKDIKLKFQIWLTKMPNGQIWYK